MEDKLKTAFSRRQMLLGTAGLAAFGLLAACGGDDDDDEPTATEEAGSGQDATAAEGDATEMATEAGGDATEEAGETEEADATVEEAATEDATEVEGMATEAASDEGEPIAGGTLFIGQDFGPQDMDPTISSAWASTNIQELIFTGLLRWSPDMQLEPDLSPSWEVSDDGLTYVFTLLEGVTFHNGQEFSSADVQYTFERIQDPDVASPRASTYEDIESIDAPDATTVQFNLSSPIAPLLRFLATIPTGAIVPDGSTDEELNADAPGTGPFVFVQHDLDQQVVLEKYDSYYEENLPYLDGVTFRLLADDTSISAGLRSESVQMAWLKDPKVAANVADTTDGLESVPGVSSRYIPILWKLTLPPFNDVRVRRAFSLALDRQAIVDAVLGGYGSVGTFLPPSQLGGYVGDGSDLPYYTQDIPGAIALLEEAGYDEIVVPEFKVVAANQLDVQCAQIMKEQWAEANIDVTINPMEVGAIIDEYIAGDYEMIMIGGVWQPDPSSEVARFHSTNQIGQAMEINDPELDALIDEGLATTDPDERVEIYKQIETLVLEQVYTIVPYTYPLRWELLWNYVKGYDVMASNARISVRKTWLDQ